MGLRTAIWALIVAFPIWVKSAGDDTQPTTEKRAPFAKHSLRLGVFPESAEALERYVASVPAEDMDDADFIGALALASRLRMALGDTDQAARNVERFVQLYGHVPEHDRYGFLLDSKQLAKRSYHQTEAAELLLELGTHWEEKRDLAWQASYWRRTLLTEAVQKNLAHRIRAEVKLARVLWRQSCPVPDQDGLCVSQQVKGRPKPRWKVCDSPVEELARPQTLARNAALARAALQGIRRALAAYPVELVLTQRRTGDTHFQLGAKALREAVDAALLIRADEQYERFLSIDSLAASSINRWSEPQFLAWLQRLTKQQRALYRPYAEIMDLSDGELGQAAAARQAQAFHLLVGASFLTPVPRPPPKPAGSSMSDQEWKAMFSLGNCPIPEPEELLPYLLQPYETCIEQSTRVGVRTPWLTQCERGAQLISPSTAPIPSEIFSSEFDHSISMDRVRPIGDNTP